MNLIKTLITQVRSPFIAIVSVVWTIFVASTQALLFPFLPNYWRRNMVGIVWSEVLLKIAFVRLRVNGLENLPPDGAVYLFNHTSNYDIPITYAAVHKFLRFGAKQSLFRVPFLSLGMRNMKVIPIDRANREKVLASYRNIYAEVKREGDNVILAPEGTRQKSEEIGPFKNGPFIFAVEAGIPLVPMVISGASDVMGKKSFWINIGKLLRTVHVKVLPTVSTQGWSVERIDELKESVRAQMITGLRAAQKERLEFSDPPHWNR